MNVRLATDLRGRRQAAGWSLDDLAARSGVSRATLARIETGGTSPTAEALNRICAAHGTSLSRFLADVEQPAEALQRRADQAVWTDPATGFQRRLASPPAPGFAAELLECALPAGADIQYDRPPRPGLEHHLLLLAGALQVTIEGAAYELATGDALRWRLYGTSRFAALGAEPARYVLALAG